MSVQMVSGTGTNSPSDYTYWEYAYAKIAHGNTIYLTPGTYTVIINQTIAKSIVVAGQSGVVIDLNGTGRAFSVSDYQTTIKKLNL